MKLRLPLVIVGIALSSLHQSSLGSLFLIVPYKSYPLWYSSILPILFLISAVALGLAMVSFESLVTSFLYRRKPETHLVAKLGRAAAWVLAFYLTVRLADILANGKFSLIFSGSWESALFLIEIGIAVIVPMIIFFVPRTRYSLAGQWVGSFLVVLGIVFNRINVGGLTMGGAS
jgi:Ni/Fe-hydrogenase subunit HybB-like protein